MRVRPFGASCDATTFSAESGFSTIMTNAVETPEKNRNLGGADHRTHHLSSPLELRINRADQHALPRPATLLWSFPVQGVYMLDKPKIGAGHRLECNGDPRKKESGFECATHHPPRCRIALAGCRCSVRPIDASSSHLPSTDRRENRAVRYSRSRLLDARGPSAR